MRSAAVLAFVAAVLPAQEPPRDFLRSLRAEPPRLLLTDDGLHELRRRAPHYRRRGIRLLSVSRDALHRVQHLAFAWRWTEDRRWLAAARDVLRARFPIGIRRTSSTRPS